MGAAQGRQKHRSCGKDAQRGEARDQALQARERSLEELMAKQGLGCPRVEKVKLGSASQAERPAGREAQRHNAGWGSISSPLKSPARGHCPSHRVEITIFFKLGR